MDADIGVDERGSLGLDIASLQSSNQGYCTLTDVTFRDAWVAAEPDGTPGRNLCQSHAVDKSYHAKKKE